MRWKKAIGMPVISTETADSLGKVEGFVVDGANSRLTGIVADGKVIDWSTSGGIGDDAVTVSGETPAHEPETEVEQSAVDGGHDPLGKLVLTEEGVDAGHATDLVFDATDGTISRVVLGDDDVNGSRLLGIGSHAVVIRTPGRDANRPTDTADMTKTELYELAKERDLQGRSTMTKKELIAALS